MIFNSIISSTLDMGLVEIIVQHEPKERRQSHDTRHLKVVSLSMLNADHSKYVRLEKHYLNFINIFGNNYD